MTAPPPPYRPSNPFAPVVGLVVFILAIIATVHLHVYWKRRAADAEAYRAKTMQAALGGTPENFLRYEAARK
jgi:hypothetical protein